MSELMDIQLTKDNLCFIVDILESCDDCGPCSVSGEDWQSAELLEVIGILKEHIKP